MDGQPRLSRRRATRRPSADQHRRRHGACLDNPPPCATIAPCDRLPSAARRVPGHGSPARATPALDHRLPGTGHPVSRVFCLDSSRRHHGYSRPVHPAGHRHLGRCPRDRLRLLGLHQRQSSQSSSTLRGGRRFARRGAVDRHPPGFADAIAAGPHRARSTPWPSRTNTRTTSTAWMTCGSSSSTWGTRCRFIASRSWNSGFGTSTIMRLAISHPRMPAPRRNWNFIRSGRIHFSVLGATLTPIRLLHGPRFRVLGFSHRQPGLLHGHQRDSPRKLATSGGRRDPDSRRTASQTSPDPFQFGRGDRGRTTHRRPADLLHPHQSRPGSRDDECPATAGNGPGLRRPEPPAG